MEMREIILVAMCLAIGPLMLISDGGIETDYRLRAAVLEPISEKTSLDICRNKVKVYQYCRHHILKDDIDITFRYRFFNTEPVSPRGIQYLKSAETGEVTTNIGLKYFWHRIFFIALLTLAGLINAGYEIWKYFSGVRRANASLHQQKRQTPPRPNRPASGQNSFGKRHGGLY